jgi:hypothetical protein
MLRVRSRLSLVVRISRRRQQPNRRHGLLSTGPEQPLII